MADQNPIQTNFTAGEISPKMMGRTDFDRYANGCEELLNFLVYPHGAATFRPGTRFVYPTKYSNKLSRLIPFVFSTVQAYQLEFGDSYIRFFKNQGIIFDGPSPYEIVSPYLEADLFKIDYAQTADLMYLGCEGYQPRQLTRTGHTSWTLSLYNFKNGPYLDANVDATKTLTPAATTGSGINVTATGHSPFAPTDVGRHINMKHGALHGWAKIASYISPTQVTVDIQSAFGATTAATNWRLGAWSNTTGWPRVCTFFENRLVWAGTDYQPQTWWASNTGVYDDMSPFDTAGVVTASHALNFTLNSKNANVIKWMEGSQELLFGTAGGEWVARASNQNEALTPTNVSVKRQTTRGSADTPTVAVDNTVLYWQKSGRKLRELGYNIDSNGYISSDITVLSEHISGKQGVRDMTWQQEPWSTVWSCRNDGLLIGCTYNQEQKVLAWHRHQIGGVNVRVLSASAIPADDSLSDESWFIVERTINGATTKYVEFLTSEIIPDDPQDKDDFCFADSSLVYNGAPATVISGLDHLIGQTVRIVADNSVVPDQVVSLTGTITLTRAASLVVVGLPYTGRLKPVRPAIQGLAGTAQGKLTRVHRVVIRFLNTLGGQIENDAGQLLPLQFRSPSDPMGVSPPLFTGDYPVEVECNYERKAPYAIVQNQPYPMTIIALMPEMKVYK